jgi:hypothetical protein
MTASAYSGCPGLERQPRPGAAAPVWSVSLGLEQRPRPGASATATRSLAAASAWSIDDGSLGLERRQLQGDGDGDRSKGNGDGDKGLGLDLVNFYF